MIPPVANRFVAGETSAEAVERARWLETRDVGAILNLLGEHYRTRAPADDDMETYRRLIGDLASSTDRGCISVKPSQLGLDVGAENGRPTETGRAIFEENLGRIVDEARSKEIFVWLDMEDRHTTDATLAAFEQFADEYEDGMGVCLQANLRRTPEDLERVAEIPGHVRLVKGAYDEPAEVAYTEKSRINEQYRTVVTNAFETFDQGVSVATHDPEMIDLAKTLYEEHGTDFEFQMLMGVREDTQYELAKSYPVRQYVPFGEAWLSYFYRRIRERKENLLFALRAILGR